MAIWNSQGRDAAELDISGTYRDAWKRTDVFVLKQEGTVLAASGEDGSWGPDYGTIRGADVEIFNLKGKFEGGKLTWSNGSIWERQQPSAADERQGKNSGEGGAWGSWQEARGAAEGAAAGGSQQVDVSGTYSDPWKRNSQTIVMQRGTELTASGSDGSWGPEYGTIRGTDIEIFQQKAQFLDGKIKWASGNEWPRCDEPVKDPWQEVDPWLTETAAADRGAQAARAQASAPPPTSSTPSKDISGTYSDPWQHDSLTAFEQDGTTLTARGADGSWGPDTGTVNGTHIEIFGLTAEFVDGSIKWSNGNTWPRVPDAGHGVATNGDSRWGTDASTGDKGAWGQPQPDANTDAQKRARWRDFTTFQEWYIQSNILPGKSPEEVAADEEKLFAQAPCSGEGIDFALYDQVTCSISGPKAENIPQLVTFDQLYEQFEDFLPRELISNIRRCGYKRPTPVQKFSIPAALSGRDVMCCAQTGSGKTAAFLIPILASLLKHGKKTGSLEKPFEGPCKPDTLVLSPTRELCLQIYDEALKFCHGTQHRCVRVYGQEPVKVQIEQLAKGGDLCIATPGRLWDFVNSGICEVTEVNCLVLDEADRQLSMNMEKFIREVVENFNMPSKENRQTLMFSATFPEECQRLATDYLYEHVFIGVGVIGGAACTVMQNLLQVSPEDKFERLMDFLNDWLSKRNKSERLLVFTNSKVQAKGLDDKLFEKNFDTGALHGDLQQTEREENLRKFRAGEIDVLVATDVASRGLDISGVSQIVNYDLPREVDVYVQRIGRTGRIGHRGYATTFIAVGPDGTWHDEPTVLQALPSIMQDQTSGCNNEVPTWLTDHLSESQKETWDQGKNWWEEAEKDKTDVRSWGEERSWQRW